MIAPNFPVATMPGWRASRRSTNRSYSSIAVSGWCGLDEARATAFTEVPVQSELAHHQNRAVHVGQGAIHLAGVVLEDSKSDHLVGHPLYVIGRVTRLEGHEQEVPNTDLADHPSLYGDVGFADALKHDPHRGAVTPP